MMEHIVIVVIITDTLVCFNWLTMGMQSASRKMKHLEVYTPDTMLNNITLSHFCLPLRDACGPGHDIVWVMFSPCTTFRFVLGNERATN